MSTVERSRPPTGHAATGWSQPLGCSLFRHAGSPESPGSERVGGGRSGWRASVVLLAALGAFSALRAMPGVAPPPSAGAASARGAAPASVVAGVQEGPLWSELKPPQQAALAPLRAEWASLDIRSKRKWLELSDRFPKLSAAEQSRVQARMGEWIHMTPVQRGQARLNFQQAKTLEPNERQARWDAYQALAPEEKTRLAARSAAQASAAADPLRRSGSARAGRDITLGPTGLGAVAQPRAIGPTVVQATPGATTTLIDRRPTPPEHQRLGVARIGHPAAAAAASRSAAVVRAPAGEPISSPNLAPPASGAASSPAPGTGHPAVVHGAPSGGLPVGPRSDTEPGAPPNSGAGSIR